MIDYTKINKNTYNEISKVWDTKREYAWEPIIDFLKKQKGKKSLTILDLGCGTGRHLELAKELKYDSKNLIGADISENQLQITSEKGFKTIQTNMTNLPFNNECFNIILCIASHHHLLKKEEHEIALNEMQRCLKPNGKLFLCNWFPSEKYITKETANGKFKFLDKNKQKVKVTFTQIVERKKQIFDRYYYLFKEEELTSLCEKANLNIIDKKYHNGNLYLEMTK